MEEISVLVVGAGPTGLTLAAELARRGVKCRLVERAPEPAKESRALAVHARTLELWDTMGIVDEAISRGMRGDGICLHVGGRQVAHLTFDGIDSPFPFVLFLPQSDTERLLIEHLDRLGVRIERQVELSAFEQDAEGVTATLRHADGAEETVRTAWLVGCDGSHSTVRKGLGLRFEGSTYEETWAIADVRLEWGLPKNRIHGFFHREGPLMTFPLPNGIQRIMVDTQNPPGEGRLPPPTVEFMQEQLNHRGPGDARILEAVWLSSFRLHLRQTARYRVGRVFLAGDACHIHSPAGGQGMNTGIQDAANLAWKLALACQGRAALPLLETYEPERHHVGEAVLELSNRMFRAASLKNPVAQTLRNTLVPLVTRQEPVRRALASRMAQLRFEYPANDAVEEGPLGPGAGWAHGAPAAGSRMPDVLLQEQDGRGVRIMELLRDPRYLLLALTGTQADPEGRKRAVTLADEVAGRYAGTVQACVVSGEPPPEGAALRLRDWTNSLHRRLGAQHDTVYLIRPDGHVGFRSQPADGPALEAHLQRLLVT